MGPRKRPRTLGHRSLPAWEMHLIFSERLKNRLHPQLTEEGFAMLVLSRKLGQKFEIGPNVRITVVKLDKNTVRIGIEAPDDVEICREELAPRHRTLEMTAA